MSVRIYGPVRKLLPTDELDEFDCGHAALNQYLQRFALSNQKAYSAQTYVSCCDDVVAGFYSLAVGSVEPHDAAPRVIKGLARHPVPVMILARLAVDVQHQGVGWTGPCSRMHCCAPPKPLTLPAFVPCWFMPRTTRHASGI